MPGENRIDDRQSGDPREVADHMVNLQIHLGQRLVHVLHVLPGHADELPMAQQRAHLTDLGLGPKGGAEEPHGMEIWSHWHSCQSVRRPGTFFMCRAFTKHGVTRDASKRSYRGIQ